MRGAASRELLEDFGTCERDYETALWMLCAITDDVMQDDNPYVDQDRKTIGHCEFSAVSLYILIPLLTVVCHSH